MLTYWVHPQVIMLLHISIFIDKMSRELEVVGGGLSHFSTRDALLLHHSFVLPKLLYLLRRFPCFLWNTNPKAYEGVIKSECCHQHLHVLHCQCSCLDRINSSHGVWSWYPECSTADTLCIPGLYYQNNALNHCALSSAKVPSRLEPSDLNQSDRKCPDSVTILSWNCGKLLIWDVTCPDTFTPSNSPSATSGAGAVAALACHMFTPVAIDCRSVWTSDIFW